jgi:hypothetical protein
MTRPPRTSRPAAAWFAWHGRDLGGPDRVIGHCDQGPWNIVARDGQPVALIDWDFAGPVDPLVELAQACWLNAKLHDDIVAEREGLPSAADRARQLRAMTDAYGLSAAQRRGFVDRIIEFIVSETAWEADDARVTPELISHPDERGNHPRSPFPPGSRSGGGVGPSPTVGRRVGRRLRSSPSAREVRTWRRGMKERGLAPRDARRRSRPLD